MTNYHLPMSYLKEYSLWLTWIWSCWRQKRRTSLKNHLHFSALSACFLLN